ncbi:peptidyl-tRNA hydrolase [Oscillospiraceae bacterium]|nr:peptidyl-tRNA hydrolase [Oscillospiraceae bacterium]
MFFSKSKTPGVTWLIVGLGNMGGEYDHTRHNVGFDVVDALADLLDIPVQRLKYKALTNTAVISGEKVLLMKPVTFMNLSGEAVEQAASFYKVPPERILVISDEVALPPGKLRVRPSGSAGGHNGLKNIIAHLHSDQFPRIRVGVGQKPHPDYDMADWVLGRPQGEDRKAIDDAVSRAAQAVECIVREGTDRAMNKFN